MYVCTTSLEVNIILNGLYVVRTYRRKIVRIKYEYITHLLEEAPFLCDDGPLGNSNIYKMPPKWQMLLRMLWYRE